MKYIGQKVLLIIHLHSLPFFYMTCRPIHHAAQNPSTLDNRTVQAVWARRELDLRTGAAFTRLLTLKLKAILDNQVISYGKLKREQTFDYYCFFIDLIYVFFFF